MTEKHKLNCSWRHNKNTGNVRK